MVRLTFIRDDASVKSQPLFEHWNLKDAPEALSVLFPQLALLAARKADDKMPQPSSLLAPVSIAAARVRNALTGAASALAPNCFSP